VAEHDGTRRWARGRRQVSLMRDELAHTVTGSATWFSHGTLWRASVGCH
jgi:hypothetical protein